MKKNYDNSTPVDCKKALHCGFGRVVVNGNQEAAYYELGDEPSLSYHPHRLPALQWVYIDPDGDAVYVRPPQTMGELYRLCDALGSDEWPIVDESNPVEG